MSQISIYILELLVALFVAFPLIRSIIKVAHRKGIVGKDIYKKDKRDVAEMGGIAILMAYSIGLLVTLYFVDFETKFSMLAALSGILFVGLVGIIDDLFELKHREKMLLPIFGAVPLIFATVGVTAISLPFVGIIDLGWIYTLILIPIAIMVTSNLTNMLAGFNGLEAGMGLISSAALVICAAILGRQEVILIVMPLIGALITFLYFNRYPAKIFPGDSGTLMIGCTLGVAVIVGNMELIGVLIMSLYIINFLMYFLNVKKFAKNNWKFGKVDDHGYIHPPDPKARFGSLYFLVSHYFKVTEKTLVLYILSFQAFFCLIIILFTALNFA